MHDLTQIRSRIDAIDSQMIDLFLERMSCAEEVAAYKRASGKPIYDAARERDNIARAAKHAGAGLEHYAAVLETLLMEASREAQYQRLGQHSEAAQTVAAALASQPPYFPEHAFVACQGVEGSYQQIATDRLFKRANIAYFDTFDAVFSAVERGVVKFGVLPIENSTAGSVSRVFDLMMQHDFHIVRTVRLRIDHNLLVPPGVTRKDVRIIYSHEQAINQCAGYISTFPNVRVHVTENTAVAARMVAESGRKDVAALASQECAALYDLDIAEENVQDLKNNYTRFACISKELTIYPGAERSTLMIETKHEPGALYKVLARFSALDINIVKLESRPIPEREFDFMFYFDVECAAASPRFLTLMNSLSDVCENFRYLGSYTEVV
ncbi:MAG: bifunctional chorismate mutase/prephenate dehydratase [Atopobiaceae bacterium]|jgi:chorismate mutase/prephenate dehydratase